MIGKKMQGPIKPYLLDNNNLLPTCLLVHAHPGHQICPHGASVPCVPCVPRVPHVTHVPEALQPQTPSQHPAVFWPHVETDLCSHLQLPGMLGSVSSLVSSLRKICHWTNKKPLVQGDRNLDSRAGGWVPHR